MRVAGRIAVLRAIAQVLRRIDMPTLVWPQGRSQAVTEREPWTGPILRKSGCEGRTGVADPCSRRGNTGCRNAKYLSIPLSATRPGVRPRDNGRTARLDAILCYTRRTRLRLEQGAGRSRLSQVKGRADRSKRKTARRSPPADDDGCPTLRKDREPRGDRGTVDETKEQLLGFYVRGLRRSRWRPRNRARTSDADNQGGYYEIRRSGVQAGEAQGGPTRLDQTRPDLRAAEGARGARSAISPISTPTGRLPRSCLRRCKPATETDRRAPRRMDDQSDATSGGGGGVGGGGGDRFRGGRASRRN